MSNVTKIAVPLLLLAALAGGAAYCFNQAPHEPPPVASDPTPAVPKVEPTQEPAPVVTTPLVPEPTRTAVVDTGNSHADAAQGVRGRVLLPNGGPAAGVPVYLLESMLTDMAQIFINNKTGRTSPPVAAGMTGADGSFALGVRKVGKGVDLRVVSDVHPEFNRQSIKVRDGDWYDAGDLQLEQGLVVQGRVVETHSKAPVANATVFLISSHQSHTMVSAPGRERGIPMATDQNGLFRFTNAPRLGLVNLQAEAPGYASGQVLNQMLKQDALNEFSIELEVGQAIAGVVVDPDGKPILGATIAANGLSTKTPQSASVTSGPDGTFEFPTLRAGPYQLTATSQNHAEVKAPLVLTGETDVKLVMSSRGSVKLKVLAANDQAVKAYRISLKKHFPQSPASIGNMLDWPDRSINPGDYPRDLGGEWALIKGLPSGDYRFQITDNAHAKTLSPAFTVEEGGAPVEVVCKMTLGGTITGTVIDDRGQPVADATITTDMNGGLAADTGIFELFRSMMPEKHTKQSARTDSQGRFRINKLAFADYMIRASHQSYCEGTAIDLKLENEGQVVDAGVIQLSKGAIVEGMTMVGGQPTGQVKVTLSTPMTAENLPTAPAAGNKPGTVQMPGRILFNATVQSDGDGRFRLLKRVPPGTYKATATRPSAGNDPFGPLMDIKETEQTVVVAPGQETLTLTFQLARR